MPAISAKSPQVKTKSKRFICTDAAVKKLKSKSVQCDCFDDDQPHSGPGFGAHISPNDTKSWQLVLRVFDPVRKPWTPARRILGRIGRKSLTDTRTVAYELRKLAADAKDVRKLAQRRSDEVKAVAQHAAVEAAKIISLGAARTSHLARGACTIN